MAHWVERCTAIFLHTSKLCLTVFPSVDKSIMLPCAAGQHQVYELLQPSRRTGCALLWVVGILHCDRNMYWEDKLQACMVKNKKRGYLQFTHSTRGKPCCMEKYEITVLDWPTRQRYISSLTDVRVPQ